MFFFGTLMQIDEIIVCCVRVNVCKIVGLFNERNVFYAFKC